MKPPSTKASILILLIVILATSIIVFSDYFEKEEKKEVGIVEVNLESKIDKTKSDKDSDGDGLLDWEETLWKTDIQKYDTDGDKTNDSEEIKLGRNPLVAGPNDKDISPEERILGEIKQNSTVDESSLTNQVAVNFTENYFKLKGEGSISELEKERLVSEISQKAVEEIRTEQIYTTSSIKTFDSNKEREKLVKYTDAYLSILVSIYNSATTNTQTNSAQFGNYIIQKASELILIETPLEIRNEHVELANVFYNLGRITKEFDKENEDPLYVMLLIPIYNDLLKKSEDINNSIEEFLTTSGIIIEDNSIKIKND